MINTFKEVNWNPNVDDERKFAKSLILGFPIVGISLLFILRIKNGAWDIHAPLLVATFGSAFGVILILIPKIVRPFYLIWYFVACLIGFVISNLIMLFFYYFILTGIALVMRIMKRDHLRCRLFKSDNSYWRDASKIRDPKRYFRQY